MAPETISPYELFTHPLFLSVGAFLLLVFLIRYSWERPTRTITLAHSDTGAVTLSVKALERLVERSCRELVPTAKPKVKLRKHREKMDVTVVIRLPYSSRTTELALELQTSVTAALQGSLTSEHLGAINIAVKGFSPAPDVKRLPVKTEGE